MIFKINTDGTGFQVVWDFDGITDADPEGNLIEGIDGALYGISGSAGPGGVFSIHKDGTNYTKIKQFANFGIGGSNLVQMANGDLFGYSPSNGSLFKVRPDGTGYTILGTTGGNLLLGSDGNLYFAATSGGGTGSVSRVATNGTGLTTLYTGSGLLMPTSDFNPASLIETVSGNFIFTQPHGDASGNGGIYSITPGGVATKLKDFPQEGADPDAKPILGSDGDLYGTAVSGGTNGFGIFYKIKKDGTGYTKLYDFDGISGRYILTGHLLEMPDGFLYGVARRPYYYSSLQNGIVYKIKLDGTGFAIVKSLSYPPIGGLLLGSDGFFYGLTSGNDGDPFDGSVFKMNTNGTSFTVVYDFHPSGATTGTKPCSIIEASDGLIYGVTNGQGANGFGTIFRMDKDGSGFEKLYDFDDKHIGNDLSQNGLMQSSDGKLYGATWYRGGSGNAGTIFSLNLDGSAFATIYSANSFEFGPTGDLIELPDGKLYSSTNGFELSLAKDGSSYLQSSNYPFAGTGASSFGGLLAIQKQNQSVTFLPLPNKTFGDPTFTISASASSGLPITFTSSNPSVATVAGNQVTLVSHGITVLRVSQPGNANYASDYQEQTLMVSQPAPSISGFTPASGPIGTIVTINGNFFDPLPSNNIVFFGAVKGTVLTASQSQLTVRVPPGANYQPISVNVTGLNCSSSSPFVTTFLSDGIIAANSFAPIVELLTEPLSGTIVVSDMDGDGRSDLATSSFFRNNVSILRNATTPVPLSGSSFNPAVGFSTSSGPNDFAIADLDGDAKPDLVSAIVVNNKISVFKNNASPGTFTSNSIASYVEFTTGTNPEGIAIGDLDSDGRFDIVTSDFGNTLSLFKNTCTLGIISSGTLAPAVSISTNFDGGKIAIGDLDGDNKPDLVVARYTPNMLFSVFRNISIAGGLSATSFDSQLDFTSGQGATRPVIGDLDGDNKPELVLVNSNDQTISIFRNISTPGVLTTSSFAPKVDFATGGNSTGVVIGDLNGDGKPEIVVTNNGSNTISVFRNTTVVGSINTNSFAPKVDFSNSSPDHLNIPSSVTLADVDNDQKLDIVTSNLGGGTVSVFRNLISFPPTLLSINPSKGAVGSTITLTGTNFDPIPGYNSVKFNGTEAVVTASTVSSLTVTVPPLATIGPISVTVNGRTVLSPANFIPGPTLTGFNPVFGIAGTVVTIDGTSFDPIVSNNVVSFNGTVSAATSSTSTRIITTVPPFASTGPITITTNGLAGVSATNFTPAPMIASFNPIIGAVGTTVTITGTNFDPVNTIITLNGIFATILSITPTTIVTKVPPSSTTGPIKVNVNGQIGTSLTSFTVISITGFTPILGSVGTVVNITGTGFDPTPANNVVKFNGVAATLSASTATGIITAVPPGATTGLITVTINGQTATNPITFTVQTITGDLSIYPAVESISLYPNPAKDEIVVGLKNLEKGSLVEIIVYDLNGKSMEKRTSLGGAELILDVRHYARGNYVVKVFQNQKAYSYQFVKE